MLIVDSSFYIAQQRARVDFRQQLAPWVRADRLWTCGIIRAEVTRGTRDPRVLRDVDGFFDVLPHVQLDDAFWRDVAALAWKLDRRGHVLPIPELAVAHCALMHDASLVTLDDDFRHIPGLKHLKHLPVYH